jgi:hypothetical protein
MKRKRNLKIGETGQPGTEGRGGDCATVATGTSDEAGRARRSRDLGDVNGVSREGPGSLDGWAVPAGNPAGAEAAVVRGVNVDRRNLARFTVLIKAMNRMRHIINGVDVSSLEAPTGLRTALFIACEG